MISKKEFINKIIAIIIGSIIAAYGITLSINAGYGGATLAILWKGTSNVLGITIGQASFLIAIIMIGFVFFYDRKQIHIGTIIYQIVYSLFVDVFTPLHIYADNMLINFFIMILGIIIFSVGTGIYAEVNLGRGSYEAVTFAFVEKNGFEVKCVRIVLDIVVVLLGVLLSGKFGLCTLATILISGPAIQKVIKIIKNLKNSSIA